MAMASQITGASIVCSAICSGTNQRKHQSFASLAFVRGIRRWPVDSPHKEPVTRKMFPFDNVTMSLFDVKRQMNPVWMIMKLIVLNEVKSKWFIARKSGLRNSLKVCESQISRGSSDGIAQQMNADLIFVQWLLECFYGYGKFFLLPYFSLPWVCVAYIWIIHSPDNGRCAQYAGNHNGQWWNATANGWCHQCYF